MGKYVKRPVVIEAWQWWVKGIECARIAALIPNSWRNGDCLMIDTLEGTMKAEPGDWIIRGIKGEYYPCKPDIFEATYEAVEP